ncbi:MBL fold metallo-hydrolase [Parazoarcus communis]|uniref:MBL fold metallo-hydrolase n=1 Tax=Parazoarcus communis SWub3 = DSM 12120 TaxID=1121029 RepID=A0A323UZR8_9RHOO|nr:MBL fold metallo-hydrolase [Parazoarcus communis]NMG70374.1 MBL fold metallo-hydrolase [Parazoarcus communis SWub3 = DSM 12120]PZA17200.1 MBL fold metallo-hydrolase [Azoarcus communis] [Parazoarcus communis SWub3 = DSM 12120]
MYFRILENAQHDVAGYLLADLGHHRAVVIDPPATSRSLICALLDERRLQLSDVLLTHLHANDDGHEVLALGQHTGAAIRLGKLVAHPPEAATLLEEDDTLTVGDELIHAIATPGHTAGCISYRWRDRLFCGDVFDIGSCAAGNIEADAGALFDSLTRRILTLPDETLVFPAHGIRGQRVSTIGEQRRRLSQVTRHSREAFVTEMAFRRLARPALEELLNPAN